MLRGVSYRFRLPMSLVATVLFTTLVLGVVITWHTYQNVRVELVDNGSRLGFALASALRPALLHDDVWLAYTILRGPARSISNLGTTLVVVDEENRVFASNKPRLLPVAVPLNEVDAPLATALGELGSMSRAQGLLDLETLPERLILVSPITSDGVPVGRLILAYPRQVLWPRFASIVEQGGVSVALVLAAIIPIGWFWGQRMVAPLLKLAACLARMRQEDPTQIECSIEEGEDEIGRLNSRFRELLVGMREKVELERRMVASERLAAVGRLAAGVAHEINNPLGGMLLALDTLRKRGIADTHILGTLSLVERGLTQIQETVSALLVEAQRDEPHSLTKQDIEDTRTLVSAHADKRAVRMKWDNRVIEPLPLPSTLVRQVVINLLLNAVQSAPRSGQVTAVFIAEQAKLTVTVNNDGDAMDRKTLEHLFEPYFSNREGGSGLGLWVTYQIVEQLGGEIDVVSRTGDTCFSVALPLSGKEVSGHAA